MEIQERTTAMVRSVMSLRYRFVLVAALLCVTIAHVFATDPEPIEIGSRRELFVDRYLIDSILDARLQLHHPRPREISLIHDAPWEGTGSGYHSVFQDGDLYRMYYKAWHLDVQPDKLKTGSQLFCCYAESDDGVHWRKPDLGLHEFDGASNNNIVMVSQSYGESVSDPGHCAVFKDDNPDADSDAQYKAIIRAKKPHGLLAFQSPDGLHWKPIRNDPVITNGAFDSQNLAFWDPTIGRYRAYWRYFTKGVTSGKAWKPGGVRAIRTATSRDFKKWEDERDLEYLDSPVEQLYTNQIKPYHRAPHILIGFPARYVDRGWSDSMRALPDLERRQWRARASQRYGTALTDTLLMSSRDGVKFHRWNEAFLRPGIERPDAWHYGQQYVAWHIVETKPALEGAPNELSLYASESYWHGKGSRLRRYTLRLDGFASVSAGFHGGRLLTQPVVFDGDHLRLNFSTSAAGSVKVEIQSGDRKPIEGFSLADCQVLFGDSVSRTVTWKGAGNLATLAGQPVRLLFELKDADLYAFQFVSEPELSDQSSQIDANTRGRCMSVLREAMHSDDFWPAIHAAEAMTLAGASEEVRTHLKPKLKDETDDQKRCGIARELVRAGDQEQSAVMMRILRGSDAYGHVHAAESLYKVGWTGGSDAIQEAFEESGNVRFKIMAAAALARYEQGPTRDAAFAFLRSVVKEEADADAFRTAAWILARIGNDEDVPLITNRIKDADDKLTLAFLQHALAALGDPEGRKALLENLGSSDPAVRTYAAVFAGASAIAEAVPQLIRQLDDDNRDARVRAAQALLILLHRHY